MKGIKNGCQSIVDTRGTQYCALLWSPNEPVAKQVVAKQGTTPSAFYWNNAWALILDPFNDMEC